MGESTIRPGSDEAGDSETVACLRGQAITGRVRDVSCNAEGCKYLRVSASRTGRTTVETHEGDCVLQLRLRTCDPRRLPWIIADSIQAMERAQAPTRAGIVWSVGLPRTVS